MVLSGKDTVTFRFRLDAKEMQALMRALEADAKKFGAAMQKVGNDVGTANNKIGQSADKMAAARVNFQTATQGMLNLSTAAVQTFTSISNLDRAGNRLAQSQIAVARATDLMNNKELRLNTIRNQGLGNTQQATNLSNELKTARADLLVKTDKLKIEEGALLDIQMLFVTNIANVMISSLQTIISLKNAHVASTIRQIVQERLLSTTIFTKTVPAFAAATAAGLSMNVMTKQVINTNRLLLIGIPVIGTAILAVSVAVQAYTENWGGLKDTIVSILPFMKDQKKLLGDVTDVLGEASIAGDKLNNTFEEQLGLVFRLPDSYIETAKGLDKVKAGYERATLKAKEFNIEIAKNPQSFRSATQEGGFLPQEVSIGSSNIIKTEGDAIHTANIIGSSSYSQPSINDIMRMASSGVLAQYNPNVIGKDPPQPIISNVSGNIFRQGSMYDLLNPFDTSTYASAETDKFIKGMNEQHNKDVNIVKSALKQTAIVFNEWASQQNISIRLPETAAQFIRNLTGNTNTNLDKTIAGKFKGISPSEEWKILSQRAIIRSQIQDGLRPSSLEQLFVKPPSLPGAGKFVGGGAFFEETGAFTFTGSDVTMKGLRDKLSRDEKELLELRSLSLEQRIRLDPMGYKELELVSEISNITGRIDEIETTPAGLKNILLQDILLKETVHDIVYDQEVYREKQFKEDQKLQRKIALEEIKQDRINEIRLQITKGAKAAGISESLYAERTGLGIILRSLPTDPDELITSNIRKELTSRGIGKVARGQTNIFKSEKVLEAERIRERLEFGDFRNLPTKTLFDRLIKRSFGRTGGIQLSSDDPLLRDISGFGKNRAAVFNQRMINPITGEDMGAMGIDIGRVADSISLKDAQRLGNLQKEMSYFTGAGGRASAAIAKAQSRRQIEDNMIVAAFGADYGKLRDIRQRNNDLLRFGGTMRPGMTKDQEGAVVGGFTSKQEFLAFGRQESSRKYVSNLRFLGQFGIDPLRNIGVGLVTGTIRGLKPILARQSHDYQSSLASAGLSVRGISRFGNNPYWETSNRQRIYREWLVNRKQTIIHNQSQLSRATEINLLLGYDQQQFFGSDLQLPALSDAVSAQDALMQTIGLDRTEAFQIIDTQGRGREEIDDRIRFKDRLSSISTGTTVL